MDVHVVRDETRVLAEAEPAVADRVARRLARADPAQETAAGRAGLAQAQGLLGRAIAAADAEDHRLGAEVVEVLVVVVELHEDGLAAVEERGGGQWKRRAIGPVEAGGQVGRRLGQPGAALARGRVVAGGHGLRDAEGVHAQEAELRGGGADRGGDAHRVGLALRVESAHAEARLRHVDDVRARRHGVGGRGQERGEKENRPSGPKAGGDGGCTEEQRTSRDKAEHTRQSMVTSKVTVALPPGAMLPRLTVTEPTLLES